MSLNAALVTGIIGGGKRTPVLHGQIELTPEQAKIVKDAIEAGEDITIKINFNK